MDNLRSLRKMLYPDARLADLLVSSPETPAHEARIPYREALRTFQGYALELRSRPEAEVRQELRRIDKTIAGLEKALDNPYTPLDETKFLLDLDAGNPALSADQVEEIQSLVTDLTEPCRTCHLVEEATITRVRADQRTLRRAEFDHRAHILQRRCLDCHDQIPMREWVTRDPTGVTGSIDPSLDHAAIHNLPDIQSCRTCHTPTLSSNRCITCHQFHPDQNRRSHLLLYLE